MAIRVKVGEAKTHLSELLAKVEAGEEVIIQRGNESVARLSGIPSRTDIDATIADIRRNRSTATRTTAAEIVEWRDEGRR